MPVYDFYNQYIYIFSEIILKFSNITEVILYTDVIINDVVGINAIIGEFIGSLIIMIFDNDHYLMIQTVSDS